ncbi:hypothetical protein WJX72_008980 [[Myrmecia] bisecta]|uniref:CBF1-interacting co-repressor CIR N-terminal domain-containing protein n=1 Tax=[Myrmecia] bisecta TaxID=41462 RepID=A0AAW1QBU0_9CHLO
MQGGKHRAPARGVLDGIKADAAAAKAGQGVKAGSAWSHNFLNQKPWHPLNFKNQARVFEAELQATDEAKRKAEAKAEFDAEQDYLKTLSYLNPEEQRKYQERQSISFMYMKPPGYDAAAQKVAQEGKREDGGAAVPSGRDQLAAPSKQDKPAARPAPARSKTHIADMLGAMAALQQQEKWELKHVSGMGQRSPPRGGVDITASNQQWCLEEADEDVQDGRVAPDAGAEPAVSRKLQKKLAKKRELAEAEAFLLAAGLDLPPKSEKRKRKEKKHKKSSDHRKHKRQRDGD